MNFIPSFFHIKSLDKVLLLNFDSKHIKANESALEEMARMRQKSVNSQQYFLKSFNSMCLLNIRA